MMRDISTEVLRRMGYSEGLILQGCGGDPQEWIDGINEMLTDMNILKNAKKYCYFITPYLITTDEMTREICNASKRGVDVRIITPGIPDKKLIYQVTRSYYNRFVRNGVKIYEYAPGFCHAKMCISDDETATVGTINLDFRSLYLHFENGCFLYKVDCIKDIREDFADTFAVSEDVSKKYMHQSRIVRSWQCCLRLFSPLM